MSFSWARFSGRPSVQLETTGLRHGAKAQSSVLPADESPCRRNTQISTDRPCKPHCTAVGTARQGVAFGARLDSIYLHLAVWLPTRGSALRAAHFPRNGLLGDHSHEVRLHVNWRSHVQTQVAERPGPSSLPRRNPPGDSRAPDPGLEPRRTPFRDTAGCLIHFVPHPVPPEIATF